jgi:hypothetical protein
MPAMPTPLLPDLLQADIEQLHDAMLQMSDPARAKTYYAQRLAEIITNHIKRATVQVNTTGTAAAQTGTGTIL